MNSNDEILMDADGRLNGAFSPFSHRYHAPQTYICLEVLLFQVFSLTAFNSSDKTGLLGTKRYQSHPRVSERA